MNEATQRVITWIDNSPTMKTIVSFLVTRSTERYAVDNLIDYLRTMLRRADASPEQNQQADDVLATADMRVVALHYQQRA